MKKYTIKTDKFKDENELNIFIANVADMREAQRKAEHLTILIANPTKQSLAILKRAKADFEKQVDDALKAMPPITALFF